MLEVQEGRFHEAKTANWIPCVSLKLLESGQTCRSSKAKIILFYFCSPFSVAIPILEPKFGLNGRKTIALGILHSHCLFLALQWLVGKGWVRLGWICLCCDFSEPSRVGNIKGSKACVQRDHPHRPSGRSVFLKKDAGCVSLFVGEELGDVEALDVCFHLPLPSRICICGLCV